MLLILSPVHSCLLEALYFFFFFQLLLGLKRAVFTTIWMLGTSPKGVSTFTMSWLVKQHINTGPGLAEVRWCRLLFNNFSNSVCTTKNSVISWRPHIAVAAECHPWHSAPHGTKPHIVHTRLNGVRFEDSNKSDVSFSRGFSRRVRHSQFRRPAWALLFFRFTGSQFYGNEVG